MEYNDNYQKTSYILWQYCSDEPAWAADGTAVTDFNEDNVTSMFNLKERTTGVTGNNGTKNVEIMVSLKYLSNVWRTQERLLTNYKINLDPKCTKNCVIVATNVAVQVTIFSITNTKLYVPVATLSTRDNIKLLQQWRSDFKRAINWTNIVCSHPLPVGWRSWISFQIFKKGGGGGLKGYQFFEGVAGKEGVPFLGAVGGRGWSFCIKGKLISELLNGKKGL